MHPSSSTDWQRFHRTIIVLYFFCRDRSLLPIVIRILIFFSSSHFLDTSAPSEPTLPPLDILDPRPLCVPRTSSLFLALTVPTLSNLRLFWLIFNPILLADFISLCVAVFSSTLFLGIRAASSFYLVVFCQYASFSIWFFFSYDPL